MTQTKCRIWYDPKVDGYHISCAYSPQFVEFIKAAVPVSDRAFDPVTKHWTVTEKFFPILRSVAEKVWQASEIIIVTKDQTRATASAPVHKASLDSVIIEFVKLLPADALTTAYRKAAVAYHPDRGGDSDRMSRLNALWTRIEAELIAHKMNG